MAEFLIEILSEEIPARMQARAAEDFKNLVTNGLKEAGLGFDQALAYVTPRRLALVVEGLPTAQPDVSEERKGPNVKAPEQAQNGFRNSLPEGAKVEERETPKGTFFFAIIDKKGRATKEVLAEIISETFTKMPWPKSMRWGANPEKWVRPLQGILALFDGDVIDVEFAGVKSSDKTLGHRFLSSGHVYATSFAEYKTNLAAAKVLIDVEERKAIIRDGAKKLAEAEGLVWHDDNALLNEVAGLVEWPVPLIGTIDDEFMEVPKEVLITSMAAHQKYFSCLTKDGELANRFIVVANTEASDGNKQIVAGNERVLRARLSDAKFFWDQDHKKTLEERIPALEDMVFHAKLGTVKDKVGRIGALAASLCQYIDGANEDMAKRASLLCKSDLVSDMVYEFPEVQGTMGRYYALREGEPAAVAEAIADHYSPAGPNDDCPTQPVSVAVAMADKIDILTGFWAIDEKPTGSKDPFALRRAALGVIRLIVENGLRVSLKSVLKEGLAGHEGKGNTGDDVADDLIAFFADRLKVHLKEKGVRHDLITAVFALGGEDDLVRLLARVDALGTFLGTDDGANLLAAYKRAANILRIEEKKDGKSYAGAAEAGLLTETEEKTLHDKLVAVTPDVKAAVEAEKFDEAMAALASLRGPVDAFFDKVTVNAEDAGTRENRLKLLSEIRSALEGVADFSKIEG